MYNIRADAMLHLANIGLASAMHTLLFHQRNKYQQQPYLKTCSQCGCEYNNRGKICKDCFEGNGGKIK